MSQLTNPLDEAMMARAIALSKRGYPAPNPHVGCVIAQGRQIVGEGFHDHAGGPHAEVVALRNAGAEARGGTAYVTLEPCNHQGRTPPCSDALIEAGIKRVVAAGPDPNPRGAGGFKRLAARGVETSLGLMAQEAKEANLAWLTAAERGWPYVVVKAAMTLDGRIATPLGESKWITGEKARREGHRLRAECGAVLVGRKTVEQDDPALTVRSIRVANQPTRIVLDPSGNLDGSFRVFDGNAPTIRIGEGGLLVPCSNSQFDLKLLLKLLADQGITSLLVEGGAHTIGSFLEAGLVDRLELFIAPKVFGAGKSWIERHFSGPPESADQFDPQKCRKLGDDLWLTLTPKRVPALK